MGLYKKLTVLFVLATTLLTAEESKTLQHIKYLIYSGSTASAIDRYDRWYKENQTHDFDTLESLGLALIEEGWRSRDPETKLMALFGAGIASHDKTMHVLTEGLKNQIPQLQLISLNFLAKQNNDEATQALHEALLSPHLLIRLEAAFFLSQNRDRLAIDHVETLLAKTDPVIRPIFPKIFASAGTTDAIKVLRRLLNDPNENVRVASIMSIAEFGRDDLLPKVRQMALQHNVAQQEACAVALGALKDESSYDQLKVLAGSPTENVRIAACQALISLGYSEYKKPLIEAASKENLYAITALGQVEDSESTLVSLTKSTNVQVRVAASIALLDRQCPYCLPTLYEALIKDGRDLAIMHTSSAGGALPTWKVIPSASNHFSENPVTYELAMNTREQILEQTLDLPHNLFLAVAESIFETQQNSLVPATVAGLEKLQTPEAIDLLKKYQQKIGAPLIRNYCTLALYRMRIPGPYAEQLLSWLRQSQHIDLIKFRPFLPMEKRYGRTPYDLTPEETSRFLIDTFETFTKAQNEEGIYALLNAIRYGNEKNRYALAGLLIRTNL